MSADTTPSTGAHEAAALRSSGFSREARIGDIPYEVRGRNLPLGFEITVHDPNWQARTHLVRGEVSAIHPYIKHDGEIAYTRVSHSHSEPENQHLTQIALSTEILPIGDPYSEEKGVRELMMETLLAEAERRGWTVTASGVLNVATLEWLETSGYAARLS